MPLYRVNATEYYFVEKCHITEWWNNAADNEVSVARVRVEPGVRTEKHALAGTTERYLILEGEGIVEYGNEPSVKVSCGDVVIIYPEMSQSITNTGSADLIFLAVCTPRFVPENYRDEMALKEMSSPSMQMPVIETERLVLRPFRAEDAPDVQRLAGDFAIADTTGLIPHPYPDGAAEQWISTHENDFRKKKALVLAIEMKDAPGLAGCISIDDIDSATNAGELGYWIAKGCWGKGICTEAARSIIEYAFETMGLNRIMSRHFARNPASGRVMEKAGMMREGYLRQAFVKWGKVEDDVLYAILREDWLKNS